MRRGLAMENAGSDGLGDLLVGKGSGTPRGSAQRVVAEDLHSSAQHPLLHSGPQPTLHGARRILID
ncbi:MAG: hypothetical protein ACR2M4_02810 [Actinomycetota bacterium]